MKLRRFMHGSASAIVDNRKSICGHDSLSGKLQQRAKGSNSGDDQYKICRPGTTFVLLANPWLRRARIALSEMLSNGFKPQMLHDSYDTIIPQPAELCCEK